MYLAIDLFCGAGGATKGLQQAGFYVIGVDYVEQPNYCGDEFMLADALEFDCRGADFVWASPPCQAFTAYRRRPDHVHDAVDLIGPTRDLLMKYGGDYVIENVKGASLINPAMLCGSMFNLDVRRHRYFESSFRIHTLECMHHNQKPRFPSATNRKNLRKTVEVGVWRIPLAVQQQAMGIDWMKLKELSQAIPPAYSKYIAEQWLRLLTPEPPK